MNALYAIRNLCHRQDGVLGVHGFSIDLSPDWRLAVGNSELDQERVNHIIQILGRSWLDCTGYGRKAHDGQPSYEPRTSIRVQWGEWGPEHISVPGNACGLDIDRSAFGCLFRNGRRLVDHNIDSLSQKYLLLIVFTTLAGFAQMDARLSEAGTHDCDIK